MAMTGAVGWLRQNLLSTPFNIALTILIALLLIWVIPELHQVPVDRRGVDRRRPRRLPRGGAAPANRRLLALRLGALAYFIYGSYPIPERWRVDVFFAMLAVGVVWLLWLEAPRRESRRSISSSCCPICSVHPAARLCR